MSRKSLASWLLLTVTAACSLPLALGLGTQCAALFMGWCSVQPNLAPVLIGLALLPILISGLFGTWAGLAQLWRTTHILNPLRTAVTPALPTELQQLSQQLGLTGRIDLIDMPIPLAFCYGLLRPRIMLTTGLRALLAPDELAAVLQHERTHLRRYDPLRAWLWTIGDGLWWWAPGAAEEARLRHELIADQAVITAGDHQPLARAVLKLVEYTHGQSRIDNSRLAMSGLSATEARIDQLLQPERARAPRTQTLGRRFAPLIGFTAITLCVLTMGGIPG
jgi:beta-lactamase regulating signal transducer with metallopeptidase domain